MLLFITYQNKNEEINTCPARKRSRAPVTPTRTVFQTRQSTVSSCVLLLRQEHFTGNATVGWSPRYRHYLYGGGIIPPCVTGLMVHTRVGGPLVKYSGTAGNAELDPSQPFSSLPPPVHEYHLWVVKFRLFFALCRYLSVKCRFQHSAVCRQPGMTALYWDPALC